MKKLITEEQLLGVAQEEHKKVAARLAAASRTLIGIDGLMRLLGRPDLRKIRVALEREITECAEAYCRDYPTSPPIYHFYAFDYTSDEKPYVVDVLPTSDGFTQQKRL